MTVRQQLPRPPLELLQLLLQLRLSRGARRGAAPLEKHRTDARGRCPDIALVRCLGLIRFLRSSCSFAVCQPPPDEGRVVPADEGVEAPFDVPHLPVMVSAAR